MAKFIITEQQADNLIKTIIKYLDDNLTPFIGWEPTKTYKKELLSQEFEIFLNIEESEDGGGDVEHMYYVLHKNPYANVKKEDSPLVLIPDSKFRALDGYFGHIWRPIFIDWFQKNTGLKVKNVKNLGWDGH